VVAFYVAWLVYGHDWARRLVPVGLFVVACLTIPADIRFGLTYGRNVCRIVQRVERGLRTRVPAQELVRRACPALYPDPKAVYDSFQMLKAARFGEFASFNEDRTAVAPSPLPDVRR
jgi:hypothetical protein